MRRGQVLYGSDGFDEVRSCEVWYDLVCSGKPTINCLAVIYSPKMWYGWGVVGRCMVRYVPLLLGKVRHGSLRLDMAYKGWY